MAWSTSHEVTLRTCRMAFSGRSSRRLGPGRDNFRPRVLKDEAVVCDVEGVAVVAAVPSPPEAAVPSLMVPAGVDCWW